MRKNPIKNWLSKSYEKKSVEKKPEKILRKKSEEKIGQKKRGEKIPLKKSCLKFLVYPNYSIAIPCSIDSISWSMLEVFHCDSVICILAPL